MKTPVKTGQSSFVVGVVVLFLEFRQIGGGGGGGGYRLAGNEFQTDGPMKLKEC